jgi:hypothetical protein
MQIYLSILMFLLFQRNLCQFSYVPTRVFCACRSIPNTDQFFVTNTLVPGTDITTSSNGSPYTLVLEDIHDNVNHHAIAYSGYSNPSNSTELGFGIGVVSNSSTQFVFSFVVYGSTAIRQINFALLLVGN